MYLAYLSLIIIGWVAGLPNMIHYMMQVGMTSYGSSGTPPMSVTWSTKQVFCQIRYFLWEEKKT